MLTKVQVEILKLLTSKITEKFSINQVAKNIEKAYPLVHRSFQTLVKERYIAFDSHKLLSLDYKEHALDLAYAESFRAADFLRKYPLIESFVKDFSVKYRGLFIFLVFGSAVEKKNPEDIDILIIAEDEKKVKGVEKIIDFISIGFPLKLHAIVIGLESFYEMLGKREELNIANETLNKHIILYGAESYYQNLKNAR